MGPILLVLLILSVVGVFNIYRGVGGLLNSTRIRIEPDAVTVHHGPVPWPDQGQINASSLEQLYCIEQTNVWWKPNLSFEIMAKLSNGRTTRLMGGLDRKHTAQFIEDAAESYLGIGDRPVAGELPLD